MGRTSGTVTVISKQSIIVFKFPLMGRTSGTVTVISKQSIKFPLIFNLWEGLVELLL